MKKRILIFLTVLFALSLSVAYAGNSDFTSGTSADQMPINVFAIGNSDEIANLSTKLKEKATLKTASVESFKKNNLDFSEVDAVWLYPSATSEVGSDDSLKEKIKGISKTKTIAFVGSKGEDILELMDTPAKMVDESVPDDRFNIIGTVFKYIDGLPWASEHIANYDYSSQPAVDNIFEDVKRFNSLRATKDNNPSKTYSAQSIDNKNNLIKYKSNTNKSRFRAASAPYDRHVQTHERNIYHSPYGDYTWQGRFFIIWDDGSSSYDYWNVKSSDQTRPGYTQYDNLWRTSWFKHASVPNVSGYSLEDYGPTSTQYGETSVSFSLSSGPVSIGLSTNVPDQVTYDYSDFSIEKTWWETLFNFYSVCSTSNYKLDPAGSWRIPQGANFQFKNWTFATWNHPFYPAVNGKHDTTYWTISKPSS